MGEGSLPYQLNAALEGRYCIERELGFRPKKGGKAPDSDFEQRANGFEQRE